MRVLEPRQFSERKKKSKSFRRISVGLAVGVGVVSGVIALQNPPHVKQQAQVTPAVQSVQTYDASNDAVTPRPVRIFSGNDFKNLFRSLAYPNTQLFAEPPSITGNLAADRRIRELAEARGYMMTSIPVMPIIRTGEATPDNDDLLQPLAHASWLALKEAADKDKIPLVLYSAYRSPEFQRDLFLNRLIANGASVQSIAAGRADAIVERTLAMTALPGYSRHHSGYTVDFRCEDGSPNFGASKCYAWLNSDNYERAKSFGWIPSYPEEAGEQGPEPEPWEYVWVGSESVGSQ